jgi:hypothetical protein
LKPPTRLILEHEAEFIRRQLLLSSQLWQVKAGLKRLTWNYEAGRRLRSSANHRQLLHSLIGEKDASVRNWAYKALGMIGNRDDIERLVSRLREEPSMESQTWGMAGLLRLAKGASIQEISGRAGLQLSTPLILASRLYAPQGWWADEPLEPIDISNADPLTLRWATLLDGYGQAPPNLFSARHENRVLLAALNGHDVADVSEYSIWALWQRPDYGFSDLGMPIDALPSRPGNVRRWGYRLLLKDPSAAGVDESMLAEFRQDSHPPAREGIALGLGAVRLHEMPAFVLDWLSEETEDQVRHTLLEQLAKQSASDGDFAEIVEAEFRKEPVDSPLQQRLFAATEGLPLYRDLARQKLLQSASEQGILFPQNNLFVGELNVVTKNQNTLSAGRDIRAHAISGGDMLNSANAAIQAYRNRAQMNARCSKKFYSSCGRTKGYRITIAAKSFKLLNWWPRSRPK